MWNKRILRDKYDERLDKVLASQQDLLRFAAEPYVDSGQFMALTDENIEELLALSNRLKDQGQERIDDLINTIVDDMGFHDATGVLLNVEAVIESVECAWLKVMREYETGNVAVCALLLEESWDHAG